MNPPGDERPLAAFYVRLLRESGLEAALVETPSGDSTLGRAAAWGRLRGRGGRAPLVLLSHLDVVPANPDDWEIDPFAGAVLDGHVVGRGALDAKGVSVVHLLTLDALARRGVPLERDVIFLATPDEETGGTDGAGWVARVHRELLGGAKYLLTEGGSVVSSEEQRADVWGVGVTEKGPCWLRLSARGTPGHGSAPRDDAAVPRLVAALERVRRLEHPLRVVPEVERMFAALAPALPPEEAARFRQLRSALASDPAFRERFLDERGYAALVRDTVSPTVLSAGDRTNVVPAEARAELDARLLPGRRCEAFVERIVAAIGDPSISVEPILSFSSRSAPIDTPLYRAIERVAARSDPDAIVVPRVGAGFTDAHWFRELGVVAYGFTPRWHRPGEQRGIHGAGERLSIENLTRGVEALIEILQELDRIEAEN